MNKQAGGREIGGDHAAAEQSERLDAAHQLVGLEPDKEGLAVCGSFDQCVRVVIVTRLNKV